MNNLEIASRWESLSWPGPQPLFYNQELSLPCPWPCKTSTVGIQREGFLKTGFHYLALAVRNSLCRSGFKFTEISLACLPPPGYWGIGIKEGDTTPSWESDSDFSAYNQFDSYCSEASSQGLSHFLHIVNFFNPAYLHLQSFRKKTRDLRREALHTNHHLPHVHFLVSYTG